MVALITSCLMPFPRGTAGRALHPLRAGRRVVRPVRRRGRARGAVCCQSAAALLLLLLPPSCPSWPCCCSCCCCSCSSSCSNSCSSCSSCCSSCSSCCSCSCSSSCSYCSSWPLLLCFSLTVMNVFGELFDAVKAMRTNPTHTLTEAPSPRPSPLAFLLPLEHVPYSRRVSDDRGGGGVLCLFCMTASASAPVAVRRHSPCSKCRLSSSMMALITS